MDFSRKLLFRITVFDKDSHELEVLSVIKIQNLTTSNPPTTKILLQYCYSEVALHKDSHELKVLAT